MASSNPVPEVSEKALTDERWALVERIASSQHLKSSARLREFLFYIADCAIREAPEEATEQQIGIRIFHRHPGYNSSEDSIVRTHARLLRQKLAVYFIEEGSLEPVIVEIPKGHYLPVFRPHDQAPLPSPTVVAGAPELNEPVKDVKSEVNSRQIWMFGMILLALGVCALLIWRPWAHQQPATRTAIDSFWQPFFSNDDPPLVVFSNALFTGNSTDGLKYAQERSQDGAADAENYVDTYTGIGELASVYTLTRLFDEHHSDFILKRSLLMTWDEAKTKNLIFIGSTVENPSLRVLQATKDFTMIAMPGQAGVVNHNPKPGEPAVYMRPERPLKVDYAILALLPGVQPNKRMLVFSGLTTFGTQAAVEYVSRPDTVADLLHHVTGPKGEIRPFEAVLETTIGGGVPLQTHLVTIRVH